MLDNTEGLMRIRLIFNEHAAAAVIYTCKLRNDYDSFTVSQTVFGRGEIRLTYYFIIRDRNAFRLSPRRTRFFKSRSYSSNDFTFVPENGFNLFRENFVVRATKRSSFHRVTTVM